MIFLFVCVYQNDSRFFESPQQKNSVGRSLSCVHADRGTEHFVPAPGQPDRDHGLCRSDGALIFSNVPSDSHIPGCRRDAGRLPAPFSFGDVSPSRTRDENLYDRVEDVSERCMGTSSSGFRRNSGKNGFNDCPYSICQTTKFARHSFFLLAGYYTIR